MSGPITALVEALVAAKATPEMILAAVRAAEQSSGDALARRRASDAARQASMRERTKQDHVTSRDVTTVVRDDLSPLDVPPLPPSGLPPSPPLNPPSPKISARDELSIVLDEERAQAVIDHRQRIRKPLTAHAAKLLAGKLAKCPDPNAAADAMIANGWQGFEPDWLDNRRSGSGPPKQRGPTFLEIAQAARAHREQPNPDARTPPLLRLAK